MRINNPIIQGFYPDPSIIRVNDDFYMVHSSFEYFPAIPLWHSKDLKNWQQIGHVIDRASQGLDLSRVHSSGGVQAATLRHHQGTFYVTSTRINPEWPRLNYHFVVTTQDIYGPWSQCHFIEDAPGIDSALFFDDDQAYFLANRAVEGSNDPADTEIWMQALNLQTFALEGEKKRLWGGTGGIFPEGPRLFKKDGRYYLLIAEGGTLHHHTVTVASSEEVWGPYRGSPRNPLLTHKHLHRTYPIQNVGHADLVFLKDGQTVGVCLGSRPQGGFYDGGNTQYSFGGYYRNLGRETFIFPVHWPDDEHGPLLSPGSGKIEASYSFDTLEEAPLKDIPLDFSEKSVQTKWVTRKQDSMAHISRSDQSMILTLRPTLDHSFFGIRQTSWNANYQAIIDAQHLYDGTALFVAFITEKTYGGIAIKQGSMAFITVDQGVETIHHRFETQVSQFHVRLQIQSQAYTFQVNASQPWTMDGRFLSCDLNDAHTGVMIGFTGESTLNETLHLSEFNAQID